MGGVYGSFLTFFPELFQRVQFYEMTPLETAGYKDKKDIAKFLVIFQDDQGNGLTGPAGRLSYHAQWRTLDISNNSVMWSESSIPIGAFFKHPDKDHKVHRVIKLLNYDREGGFYEYGVQLVTGDNGEQTGALRKKMGMY